MALHSSSKHDVDNTHVQPLLLLIILIITLLISSATAAQAANQPGPSCATKCGSVDIPFPFGTTEACSYDHSFLIDCNTTTPFLPQSNLTVLSISLNGEIRVSFSVSSDCYNDEGNKTSQVQPEMVLDFFSVSTTRNKLTVVGCDTVGLVIGADDEDNNYTTGCVSLCNKISDTRNGSCAGTGCCETSIPGHGITAISYATASVSQHRKVSGFNRCGYAFVVEDGGYEFVSSDLGGGNKLGEEVLFPVVLDWGVGTFNCQEVVKKTATGDACKAEHSHCYDSVIGHRCNCSTGFQGNPYLLNGCQDVDECKESNDCYSGAICHNIIGGYNCSCPDGYEGDGRKDGTKCTPKSSSKSRTQTILIIALSVSIGVLAILVASFYVYWRSKKRKLNKLKDQFFQQNGGLLLQQQIAQHRGSTETAKVFTVEELKKATDNFDEGKILGQGGQGTVYKGLLLDDKTVAIKKSKISDSSQIEQFINEVVVLSQINHRNVVKLLGCCLETEVPLLVYEFIPSGTISDQLHDHSQSSKRLTWKTRLRIASETAGALAYLHSATSMPIIHRDVKTANILLDHNLTAKVSDFGASRIVPLDKAQVTTLVQGTLGYLDPEYFHTSQLTEKSDVYSFGVVLAELLTGRKALSFDVPEDERNLALYFVSSMKEGRLLDIVDKHVIDEAKVEQITEFANIARRCLRLTGEDRPTMKEVAMELEGIRAEEKHKWDSEKSYAEETEILLKATPSVYDVQYGAGDGASGSGISSGFDSISQIPMSLGGGR